MMKRLLFLLILIISIGQLLGQSESRSGDLLNENSNQTLMALQGTWILESAPAHSIEVRNDLWIYKYNDEYFTTNMWGVTVRDSLPEMNRANGPFLVVSWPTREQVIYELLGLSETTLKVMRLEDQQKLNYYKRK